MAKKNCDNYVIVITGPTAVGKTKLSIDLAKHFNGEIINADSTQIFKSLDIATAKVTEEEKENIVHHLIDIKTIEQNYTVYDYQRDCRNKISEVINKNKIPIIVGGTGLYIKAALYDYKFSEEQTKIDYSKYDNETLYSKWLKINPNTLIHKNNRKRIERALSYYEINHKLIEEKEKTEDLLYKTIFIGLTTNRENLYNRISKRVDIMFEKGLLEEAKSLYNSNIRTKAIMTPIGYKELFDYFDNKCTLEETKDLIKQKSKKYAKRQYTWFNNQMDIKWFDVCFEDFDKTLNEIIKYIEEGK